MLRREWIADDFVHSLLSADATGVDRIRRRSACAAR